MINIENLSFYINGKQLYDNANLNLPSNSKVGLIGINGIGKSTIFKIITGKYEADSGMINIPKNMKVGFIKQDLSTHYENLIDLVLSFDEERERLYHQLEIEPYENHAEIYERLNMIDADMAPVRAKNILTGLGFDEEMQQKKITEFSGGWRIRVAMAGILFTSPDILLLDEPTNHLDFEAVAWLEQFIRNYKGMVVIISHDRHFLNSTIDYIVQIENKQFTLFRGNFDQFMRQKSLRMANQQAAFTKQQTQKEHMMKFVNRFKAKATKAKQAQSRLKMIERMTLEAPIIFDNNFEFSFDKTKDLPSPLLAVEEVDVWYDADNKILKNLNFRIDPEDRIAILGANGNGKSTLVKFIYGDKDVHHSGEITYQPNFKIGYFAQHLAEEIDITQTAYQFMVNKTQGLAESKIRALLGSFGFDKIKADSKIAELSGGEKSRLIFAFLKYQQPDLLILDEPTNHLDIEAKQALTDALNDYQGAVIIISHDFNFIESVADDLWLVANYKCQNYDGDLEDYQKMVIFERNNQQSKSKAKNNSNKNNKDSSKLLAQLERELKKLTEQKLQLEAKLALEYNNETNEQYKILTLEIEKLEQQWLNSNGSK